MADSSLETVNAIADAVCVCVSAYMRGSTLKMGERGPKSIHLH